MKTSTFFFNSIAIIFIICLFTVVHLQSINGSWLPKKKFFLDSLLTANRTVCSTAQESIYAIEKKGLQLGSLNSQIYISFKDQEGTICNSNPKNIRYRYASLTKVFTAQAVSNTMNKVKISLTSPLSNFIPQVQQAKDQRWQKVTIQQLLNHSAGLDRSISSDSMTIHAKKPWCPYNLDQIIETQLDFDPGSDYGYSNLTYCLLGVVLEKLTGLSYREAIEQELHINQYDIKFIDGPYLEDEVEYDFRFEPFYSKNYYKYLDFNALSSSAGLSGTAEALVKWVSDQRANNNFIADQYSWPKDCDISKLRNCYNTVFTPYKEADSDLIIQVLQGYLFAAPSVLVLDSEGGILVWLGNGAAPKGSATDQMTIAIYKALREHYKL